MKRKLLLYMLIYSLFFIACKEEADDGFNMQNNNEIKSLLDYANRTYTADHDYTDVDLSAPDWNSYMVAKNNNDTLLLFIPVTSDENNNWYLVVNRIRANKRMYIARVPIDSYSQMVEKGGYFIVTADKNPLLFKQIKRSDNTIVSRKVSMSTRSALWDCWEPEKYGNCIDGGALPEVVIYPEGNSVDNYYDWWWLDMLPGFNPSAPQSNPNLTHRPNRRPEYQQADIIAKNPTVKAAMDKAWELMKKETSKEKGRLEKGFWIYYDKKTAQYYTGNIKSGQHVKGGDGTNASVYPGNPMPHANGDHIPKGALPVTFFHTHTSLAYNDSEAVRAVGFSDADIEFAKYHNIELILYDYTGVLDIDGKYYIQGGHSIDDMRQTYIYVPKK